MQRCHSWFVLLGYSILPLCSKSSFAQEFTQALDRFSESVPQEKIYISHDRSSYLPGDTIWGNVFMLEANSLQPFQAEPLIKVQWIGPAGDVLQEHQLKIKNGVCPFQIITYGDDLAGIHQLRAFSHYQLNFDPNYTFRKSVTLGSPPSAAERANAKNLSLNFYPEGGQLVVGCDSRVGCLLTDEYGSPVSSAISIFAGTEVIANAVTDAFGLASIELQDVQLKQLEAQVSFLQDTFRFDLPKPMEQGCVMRIDHQDSLKMQCQITSSGSLEGYMVVAHSRGQVFLEFTCPDQKAMLLTWKKKELPTGLVHFTVFDALRRPIAERLTFNFDPIESHELTIHSEHNSSTSSVQISHRSEDATASISIHQLPHFEESPLGLDIAHWLWLQSDLLTDLPPQADLATLETQKWISERLLVHGWSRFDWADIVDERFPTIRYPQMTSLLLAGRTINSKTGKGMEATVTASIFHDSTMQIIKLTSSEEGLFYMENLDFPDSTEILLSAEATSSEGSRSKKRKSRSEEIRIERIDVHGDNYIDSTMVWPDPKPMPYASILAQSDITYDSSLWSIDLEGVTVRARQNQAQQRAAKIKTVYGERGIFYIPSTPKFVIAEQFADSKFQDIYGLIRTVFPRAKIVREAGQPKIIYGRLSAGSEARVVVDGILRSTQDLLSIDPKSIRIAEYLDALQSKNKGYGDHNTLFFITEEQGENRKENTLAVSYPGYYRSMRYSWQNCLQNVKQTSLSKTLHWYTGTLTPGKHLIEYCTGSPEMQTYIRIEGVTKSGVPFAHIEPIGNND